VSTETTVVIGAEFAAICDAAEGQPPNSAPWNEAVTASRTVIAELDRLPVGVQVKDIDGREWTRTSGEAWRDGPVRWTSDALVWSAPLTVLAGDPS
jgi:hypothetical protein